MTLALYFCSSFYFLTSLAFLMCRLPAHMIARISLAICGSFLRFSYSWVYLPRVASCWCRKGLEMPLYELWKILSRSMLMNMAFLKIELS